MCDRLHGTNVEDASATSRARCVCLHDPMYSNTRTTRTSVTNDARVVRPPVGACVRARLQSKVIDVLDAVEDDTARRSNASDATPPSWARQPKHAMARRQRLVQFARDTAKATAYNTSSMRSDVGRTGAFVCMKTSICRVLDYAFTLLCIALLCLAGDHAYVRTGSGTVGR